MKRGEGGCDRSAGGVSARRGWGGVVGFEGDECGMNRLGGGIKHLDGGAKKKVGVGGRERGREGERERERERVREREGNSRRQHAGGPGHGDAV